MNKVILHIAVSAILAALSGCQLQVVQKASFKTTAALGGKTNAQSMFNPAGKETFTLKPKARYLQGKGYVRFCRSTRHVICKNKLSYPRFVGMKGYFDTTRVAKTDNKSYEFYPVILENGAKYFFLSLKNQGGRYGKGSPIESVSLNQNFQPKPVFASSQINILGEYHSFGEQYYLLSNQQIVKGSQLKYIREINAKYPMTPAVNNLLLQMNIEKSHWYQSYLISPRVRGNDNPIKLFIGLDDSRQWLKYKVSHTSSKSLDVNAYSIVADDLLYRSPSLVFETREVDDQVQQSFEITANQQEVSLVSALSKASRALVRIHGDSGSAYHQLKSRQKQQLSNILRLYTLLDKRVF